MFEAKSSFISEKRELSNSINKKYSYQKDPPKPKARRSIQLKCGQSNCYKEEINNEIISAENKIKKLVLF